MGKLDLYRVHYTIDHSTPSLRQVPSGTGR